MKKNMRCKVKIHNKNVLGWDMGQWGAQEENVFSGVIDWFIFFFCHSHKWDECALCIFGYEKTNFRLCCELVIWWTWKCHFQCASFQSFN